MKKITLTTLIISCLLTSYVYCQESKISPIKPNVIEHSETYKTMKKYGLTTQNYPGAERVENVFFNNVIRIPDKGEVIYAYFLVDDGKNCVLKKSCTNYGDNGYGLLLPKEINITGKIKSVISGYGTDNWSGETVLKQVLMLIEGPENIKDLGDIDLLLTYEDGKTFLGTPIIKKNLVPIQKDSIPDLNEYASDCANTNPEFDWYIENFNN